MAENKHVPVEPVFTNDAEDRLKGFWQKNSRNILIVLVAVLAIVGGYAAYKYFVAAPKEQKANEALFRAETYFRADSLQLALNGDALNPGFIKIIDKFSG